MLPEPSYSVVFVLLSVFALLSIFVFRFQRTTLGISRVLDTGRDIRGELTPLWIVGLYWVDLGLGLLLAVLILARFGWIWLLVFLVSSLVATALVDVVSPLPSYAQCFGIIKRHLARSSRPSANLERAKRAVDAYVLLGMVSDIESRYRRPNGLL